MKKLLVLTLVLFSTILAAGCSENNDPDSPGGEGLVDTSDDSQDNTTDDAQDNASEEPLELEEIVVNSLEDLEDPPDGTITLRSALAAAADGQTIVFDPGLDGGTIELTLVGETNCLLKGEIMGMREEESGPVSYLVGYFDRDYGKSALYARKDVVIDASDLPSGITLAWAGSAEDPDARILAVYGNLTMTNVSVTGGSSVAEATEHSTVYDATEYLQLYTLARGGGLAVWGIARLTDCRIYDNYCQGDFGSSRDRGAFGGGLYADLVDMEDCIVSGNTVFGVGVSGGGIFSVGGVDIASSISAISRSAITGNHISGIHTYGGGVYTDGGGIGNSKTLRLTNCTVAWNQVDAEGMPSFLLDMGYWRGGGIYMSNGYLDLQNCTIVENAVQGKGRIGDLGKPSLAGGIAATTGNAHAVESMTVGQCIISGNTVYDSATDATYEEDIFTGSLLYFRSTGYNRIGTLNFNQILVPVGEVGWASLCRKHFPKTGDETGVDRADVLDLAGVALSDAILSAGVNEGASVPLYYPPAGSALDQVPDGSWSVAEAFAEYSVLGGGTDDFLAIMLDRVAAYYDLDGFALTFTADFENFLQNVDLDEDADGLQPYTDPDGVPILTLAETLWFGPAETWPKELVNYPYIEFWHRFDAALETEGIPGMGPELLGDDAWMALFDTGSLDENGDITMNIWTEARWARMLDSDQVGTRRPANVYGDIGAVEIP